MRIPGLAFLMFFYYSAAAQTTGSINGFIRDAQTLSPLANATVSVTGTQATVLSDSLGFYRLAGLPTKTYTIQASLVGYSTIQRFDIIVTSGNTVELNFDMEPAVKELGTVEVKANFNKPSGSVNSIQTLGTNEIAKYPGANFDIAKVVQSLPGVSGSVGFRNDIIIRGGAPNENVYYLDGVEIPTINHFATQGAAGGPVGMLNVSFIDKVTMHTSAFPSKYDNPLSGVLQFRQRSGNPEKVQGNFRLSASEAALTMEGPLGRKNGKTTFLGSVRRSYLQLLFQLIDLPFLPDYWDYQYKLTHKVDSKNELNIIGLGSIDNFTFKKPDNATLEQLAILDQIPLNTQRTNTIGATWRHTMKKGSWQLVASKNTLINTADKYENNQTSHESKRILKYRSTEDENRLRYEVNTFSNGWNFNAGGSMIFARYSNDTYQRRPNYVASYASDFNFLRYGFFVQATRRFGERFSLTGGLRTDGNTFTETGNDLVKTLSPRISAVYNISSTLNANVSLGRYFKIPPYTILGFREADKLVNKDAEYIRSNQAVAGIEWLPSNATRFTVEGFYKKYDNYPVSANLGISLANLGGDFGVLGNEKTSSDGTGRAYGFEILFQQRLTKNFYGIVAYTFYHSEFAGTNGVLFPSAWDNRHLFSFTGGYKFGRNWELGVRFRYQGKAPYTPYDNYASLENYPFTNEPVTDYSKLNSLRLEPFNAADLRLDKKWNFRKWSLDLFLDIQNAYNSKNPAIPSLTLQRNADETIATTNGEPYNPGVFGNPAAPNNRQSAIPVLIPADAGSLLPSVGFVVEF